MKKETFILNYYCYFTMDGKQITCHYPIIKNVKTVLLKWVISKDKPPIDYFTFELADGDGTIFRTVTNVNTYIIKNNKKNVNLLHKIEKSREKQVELEHKFERYGDKN